MQRVGGHSHGRMGAESNLFSLCYKVHSYDYKAGMGFLSRIRDERRLWMLDSATRMECGDKSGSVKKLANALGRSEKVTYRQRNTAVAFRASCLLV